MKKEKKKKKFQWSQWLSVLFFIAIGFVCGIMIGKYAELAVAENAPLWQSFLTFALLIFAMYVVIFLEIVVHEAGHLIFGLATGYRFSSFRVGSFMWVKDETTGRVRFARYSLAGTGGQCLMCPPELVEGRIPYVLYNLGGSLINVITSVLFLLLSLIFGTDTLAGLLLMMAALIGFVFALMNGLPLRMGSVDNDGKTPSVWAKVRRRSGPSGCR